MSESKSRAEQLLAELDCHVNIDQRADALKAIEVYLVDAYEAACEAWYVCYPRDAIRRAAEIYAGRVRP